MARGAQAGQALKRHHRAAAIFAAALVLSPPLAAQSSRISVAATARGYTVGDSSVTERVASVRYELFGQRMRFRLDGAALGYKAAGVSIDGALPIGGRLDFQLRPGDTIAVFARSSSQPLDLTAKQTSALGTAGTGTLDLEAMGFGTPSLGGARATFAIPAGDLVLAVRGGVEVEPTPKGTQPVYWRGTTVRGGLALTGDVGDSRIVASVDATRSSADSLGGRNLFPGGGSVMFQLQGDLSVRDPFDPLQDMRWPIRAAVFYARPFSSDRADQPNLLIPRGDLFGTIATMLVPIGELSLSPTLQFLRETSASGSTTGAVKNSVTGSAYSVSPSLDLVVPLGSTFELTPTAGYTFGSVDAQFSQSATLRRGRAVTRTSGFSDAVRGSWFSVQLTASF